MNIANILFHKRIILPEWFYVSYKREPATNLFLFLYVFAGSGNFSVTFDVEKLGCAEYSAFYLNVMNVQNFLEKERWHTKSG